MRRLSGGNQQKVTIARWLAPGLRVMLLFDPTRGIDVGTKHQIYDLMRELADEGAADRHVHQRAARDRRWSATAPPCSTTARIVAELPADAGETALLTAAHGLARRRRA